MERKRKKILVEAWAKIMRNSRFHKGTFPPEEESMVDRILKNVGKVRQALRSARDLNEEAGKYITQVEGYLKECAENILSYEDAAKELGRQMGDARARDYEKTRLTSMKDVPIYTDNDTTPDSVVISGFKNDLPKECGCAPNKGCPKCIALCLQHSKPQDCVNSPKWSCAWCTCQNLAGCTKCNRVERNPSWRSWYY